MASTKKGKPDVRLKEFFRYNEYFADLFNECLFGGEEVIKPDDLQEADTDVAGTVSKNSLSQDYEKALDVVKKSAYGIDFVVLGLENQNKIHYAMPLRVMQGDVLLYLKELNEIKKKHEKEDYETSDEFLSRIMKNDRLHPVITLCVYYGDQEWDGPKCLKDMFKIPAKMKNFISDYKMNLIEVRESGKLKFSNPQVNAVFEILRKLYENDYNYIIEKYANVKLDPDVGLLIGSITRTKSITEQATGAKKKGEWFSMITAMQEFAQEYENKGRKSIIRIASKAQEMHVIVDYDRLEKDPAYQDEICNLLGITQDK